MTAEGGPPQPKSLFGDRHRTRPAWRRWGRLGLGLTISLGVILWLVTNLEIQQVVLALRQADYAWVSLGLVAVICTLWARVRRWHTLLDSQHVRPGGTLQALVIGQLLNLVFPARLGDLGRAYLITQQGYNSQAQALGTVALEKLWDIVLLIVLAVALAFWQPLPAWFATPIRLTGAGGGILLVSVVGVLLLRPQAVFRWPRFLGSSNAERVMVPTWPVRRLGRVGGRLADGLEGIRRPRMMAAAGSWSILAWIFGALTNLVLLKAFNLPPSIGVALFLLAVLQLGVAVPSVPGRFGVFEGLCLLTLAVFGVEANLALAYGLMLHGVVLLPPLVLGLWWLVRLNWPARQIIRELP
jgi:uncharacterized membrane protein YbhN (UPF0104 family)